jgi:hypothetical protein
MTSRRLSSSALQLAVIYVIAVCLAYLLNAAWSEYIRAHGVEIVVVLGVLLAVALLARSKPIDKLIRATTPERLRGWVSWLALLYVVAVSIAYLLSDTFADYLQAHWPRILAVLITLLAIACFTRHLTPSFVRTVALQLAAIVVIGVGVSYLFSPWFREYFHDRWFWFAFALAILLAIALLAQRRTTDRLRQWALHLASVYVVVVCVLYLVNAPFREYVREHRLWFVDVLFALLVFAYYARPRGLELYKEYPEADEQQTIDNIIRLFIGRLQKQYAHQLTLRDTHPKSNGLLFCEFEILPYLPPEFDVGLFAEPKTYKCWLRFSNSEPEVTRDARRDFRGIALKLFDIKATLGVDGSLDTLQDDESDTFDFLFVAHDAFFSANPKDFLDFFTLLTYYGNKCGSLLYFIPKRLRLLRNSLLGRRSYGHPFEITWFSCAPFKLGDKVVKYKLHSKWEKTEPDRGQADYLRQRLTDTVKRQGHTMDFMVQLQEDPHRDLIESTGIPWRVPQFRTVARLHIPQQDFNSAEHLAFDESMTFNPWHCWPEHRPVGGMNRARRDVMRAIQEFRLAQNGRPRTNVNAVVPDDAPAAAQRTTKNAIIHTES